MSELIVSRQQQVLLLTLNCPAARNALNNALLTQLVNELEAAATDSSISVCVITAMHAFLPLGPISTKWQKKISRATLNDTRSAGYGRDCRPLINHLSQLSMVTRLGRVANWHCCDGGCRRERAFWVAGNHWHHAWRRRNARLIRSVGKSLASSSAERRKYHRPASTAGWLVSDVFPSDLTWNTPYSWHQCQTSPLTLQAVKQHAPVVQEVALVSRTCPGATVIHLAGGNRRSS